MNRNSVPGKHAVSVSSKGLVIAAAASLVLLVLAAYKVPLFYSELDGVVLGVLEMHDESDSKLIAAVRLESGTQILVPVSREFLSTENINIRINEGRSLFGRKSYRIVSYRE